MRDRYFISLLKKLRRQDKCKMHLPKLIQNVLGVRGIQPLKEMFLPR